MTTQEIINYYANLLILQYVSQPNAYAHIQTLAYPVVMNQLPLAVENAYDIGSAVGPQLDVLGKYVGVTRNGVDLTGNPITLDDSDFTSLIQIAIVRNNGGSSLASIQQLLHQYFAGEIFVYDGADMQMSYFITSGVGTQQLVEMFLTQNLLPKPMGVQLSSIIYLPTTSLFGFFDYNNAPSAWNSGVTYGLGALVYDSANGIIYQSLSSANTGNALSDTVFWKLIIYPLNDYVSYQSSYFWLDYSDTITI